MGIPAAVRGALIGLIGMCVGAGVVYLYDGRAAAPSGTGMASAPGEAKPATRIDLAWVERLLGSAESAERDRILDSEEAFRAFVEQESRNQSVLISAYAHAVDDNPAVQLLMQRAAQRVLVEAYLNEVVRGQLADHEITRAEAEAYYKDHPDQFKLPERVHLWQIFLPAGSSTERQNAQALGRQLLETLLAGKADFATLAARHSGHSQSRLNGGYMGLVPVTDLKPEVRQALEGAAAGQPVGPVESADGYHLVQRGVLVPGTTLSFEDAEPQVREFLRREALAKARAAAVARMVADHPVSFADEQLGEWRVGLLQRAANPVPPAR